MPIASLFPDLTGLGAPPRADPDPITQDEPSDTFFCITCDTHFDDFHFLYDHITARHPKPYHATLFAHSDIHNLDLHLRQLPAPTDDARRAAAARDLASDAETDSSSLPFPCPSTPLLRISAEEWEAMDDADADRAAAHVYWCAPCGYVFRSLHDYTDHVGSFHPPAQALAIFRRSGISNIRVFARTLPPPPRGFTAYPSKPFSMLSFTEQDRTCLPSSPPPAGVIDVPPGQLTARQRRYPFAREHPRTRYQFYLAAEGDDEFAAVVGNFVSKCRLTVAQFALFPLEAMAAMGGRRVVRPGVIRVDLGEEAADRARLAFVGFEEGDDVREVERKVEERRAELAAAGC